MPAGIFISYRRDDTRQAAGRLADDLSGAFGAGNIFRDIEGIDPGVEFAEALNKALSSCVVMLVLIGSQWLSTRNARGGRRLDDSDDWIALEVEVALKRKVRVIPVLIDGAKLPEAHELPERLRPLVGRQSLELDDGRWRGDMARLVETLSRIPELQKSAPPPAPPSPPAPPGTDKKPRNWKLIGGVGFAVLVVLGYIGSQQPVVNPPMPTPNPLPLVPPTLSGSWHANDANIDFSVQQNGSFVAFAGLFQGMTVGGQGQLQGNQLNMTLTLPISGFGLRPVGCTLFVSPNGRMISGPCQGPQSPFQFVIVR